MTDLTGLTRGLLLCGLLTMVSCADSETGGNRPDLESWVQLDAGGIFTVSVPQGFVYKPRRGIDSLVGLIEGNGIRIVFDYGLYSDDLDGPRGNQDDYTRTDLALANHDGKLVTYSYASEVRRAYFVGAYVPECGFNDLMALTVFAKVDTPEQAELVRMILETLQMSSTTPW